MTEQPEVGLEFVATCEGGYITRMSYPNGKLFQARLKRLPEGAELLDGDAVPYYYLGEDDVYHECYDYFAPTGFVVCEYIEDIRTPEEEAAMFAEQVRRTHNCYSLEEAIHLRDQLNRYIDAEKAKESP